MGRSDHFNAGAGESLAAYDEHMPDPGDKPGRVEFAGRQLPAMSFFRSTYSMGFTTPLENGAVAHVQYFPHQKLTNVSLHQIQQTASGAHLRHVGVLDEHGQEVPDVVAGVKAAHGERPPGLPRSPSEAVEDLEYYSKLKMPKHVVASNRAGLPAMRASWSWQH